MRLFFIMLDLVVLVAAIYFVVTQILRPALTGTKLFPFFRYESYLERQKINEQDMQHLRELEEELQEMREQQGRTHHTPQQEVGDEPRKDDGAPKQ